MTKTYFPVKRRSAILCYFTKDNNSDKFTAYFPMPIDNDTTSTKLSIPEEYVIRNVRLGINPTPRRSVLVPCNFSENGEPLLPREQIQRATKLASDIIDGQNKQLENSRCLIRGKKSFWKHCPYSIVQEVDGQQVRMHNCCDGTGNDDACPYAKYKYRSNYSTFSELSHENEDGEIEAFEVISSVSPEEGHRYLKISIAFLCYVQEQKPKLLELAKLLVKGIKLSDAKDILGKPRSTLDYQVKLLQSLLLEFLANLASFQATEF